MLRFMVLLLLASGCAVAQQRERIIGLPCEGCEAVFEGKPAMIPDRTRLVPDHERGVPMVVTGRVLDRSGNPAPGIIVYAYQTNAAGVYPTVEENRGAASHRHGKLRSWVNTDKQGRYAFDTIRPASYPGTDLPEHIHMHVIEPGCSTYYIDDIMFQDDPRLTQAQIHRLTLNRGGTGISRPVMHHGIWYVRRDILLGRNIPGRLNCSK